MPEVQASLQASPAATTRQGAPLILSNAQNKLVRVAIGAQIIRATRTATRSEIGKDPGKTRHETRLSGASDNRSGNAAFCDHPFGRLNGSIRSKVRLFNPHIKAGGPAPVTLYA
jgi:hypothetical protein